MMVSFRRFRLVLVMRDLEACVRGTLGVSKLVRH